MGSGAYSSEVLELEADDWHIFSKSEVEVCQAGDAGIVDVVEKPRVGENGKPNEFIGDGYPVTPYPLLRSNTGCYYRKRCLVNDSVNGAVNDT
jgi:hypothetical protein